MRKLLTIFGNTLFTIMLCLSQERVQAGGEIYSETELEQMMSPVALYPDVLLIQVLKATTYPVDVAEAVNWSKNNPGQHGDAAMKVIQSRYWDLSVISLLAFPKVLAMMGRQPEWVQNTGNAFQANPEVVMEMVHKLRSKAREANNLETIEQKLLVEPVVPPETVIIIESADPKVVYMPPYKPAIVYDTWRRPYYRPRYYGFYYRPRFYDPDYRSWYYPPYGYGYGYGRW